MRPRAIGVSYNRNGNAAPGTPVAVTYADDFAVLCHSRQQAETAQAKAEEWLITRGLTLNRDKTTIRHIDEGFDFLSFNIRRYHPTRGGRSKLLIKPSKDALRKIRKGNAGLLRSMRGAPPAAVVRALNAKVRGQAAYFRIGVSKRAFSALDSHLFDLTFTWAWRRHSKDKTRTRVAQHYFGQHNPARQDRWVFGDRHSGAYLHKYAWTPIARHVPVAGRNSPDDPDLDQYWTDRRRRHKPPQLARTRQAALRDQRGRCPLCGEDLLYGDEPPDTPHDRERWFADLGNRLTYQPITEPDSGRTRHRYVHTGCANKHGATRPATHSAQEEAPNNAA